MAHPSQIQKAKPFLMGAGLSDAEVDDGMVRIGCAASRSSEAVLAEKIEQVAAINTQGFRGVAGVSFVFGEDGLKHVVLPVLYEPGLTCFEGLLKVAVVAVVRGRWDGKVPGSEGVESCSSFVTRLRRKHYRGRGGAPGD